MLKLKGCPRCHGDMYYGVVCRADTCLNCGHTIEPEHEEFDFLQVANPYGRSVSPFAPWKPITRANHPNYSNSCRKRRD